MTIKRKSIKTPMLCFTVLMAVFVPCLALAATHYVSPDGGANWAASTNSAAPSSLSTANANAAAGDVVLLAGGVYGTPISPANSGSAGNMITFQAASGATPTFSGNFFAISLVGKSYIAVKGIKATGVNMFYFIGYGSAYNEIANCTFTTPNTTYYSLALIINCNASFTGNIPSHNNWIHNNTFSKYGRVSGCDDAGTIRIGQAGDGSHHNTIENNIFYYGGHDLLDIGGKYNVVRNNVFHNDESYFAVVSGCTNSPSSGFFGNRNIILTGYSVLTTDFNLVEGNRSGYSGTPTDDDGSFGIENAGMHSLVRYNYLFGNGGAGYYTKSQGVESGRFSHIYNNTIYSNGFGDADLQTIYKGGIVVACSGTTAPFNAIKNNIIYGNLSDTIKYVGQNCLPACDITANFTSDPRFVNTSMTDKMSLTLPDLRLQSGSPAIDSGTFLTHATGAGTNSTTLVVGDAAYFQDGWGSSLTRPEADWIAIGSPGNVVQISSINYTTNTITLAAPKAWAANAGVWLYKKSDGAVVLSGTAPDAGAHEVGGSLQPSVDTSSVTRPRPPKNLRRQ